MKYFRQRYVLFEVITTSSNIIDRKYLMKIIWKHLTQIFGDYITFQAGLWMIRWDEKHKIGIIRCDNFSKHHLLTIFSFINELKSYPAIVHSIKTSGTIKKTLKIWKNRFKLNPPPREEEE
jgi:RNase P/RNase MRP subunit POP5